jgi:hypothetical protein
MKAMLTLIVHACLVSGMAYALVTVLAPPASACTPAQCQSIESNADTICFARFGTRCTRGTVEFCDAGGFEIVCGTGGGAYCGTIQQQCN